MNHLAFEWDDGKNTLNKRKHRIAYSGEFDQRFRFKLTTDSIPN
jgi:uncharacterized DUF497 family protein